MTFGQFFTEVCAALRKQFNWVAPETIATTKTKILDVVFEEYNLATDDVVNAPEVGARQMEYYVEQAVRSRINTAAQKINELKNS